MQRKAASTSLVECLYHCSEAYEIAEYIVNNPQALIEAQTCNAEGKLPIQLVATLFLSGEEKEKIYQLLLPLTLQSTVKPLSEPIDFSELTKRYPDPKFAGLLKIACEVTNQARALIQYCPTHPAMNSLSESEKASAHDKISVMRKQAREKSFPVLFRGAQEFSVMRHSPALTNLSVRLDNKTLQEYLANETAVFIAEKVANCTELSELTYACLARDYPYLQAGVYDIENGDHVVVMIHVPDHLKSAAKFLICDPWAGDIFFIDEKELRLGVYKYLTLCINNSMVGYNVVTRFDPLRHDFIHIIHGKKIEVDLYHQSDSDYTYLLMVFIPDAKDRAMYFSHIKENLQKALDLALIDRATIMRNITRLAAFKIIFSHPQVIGVLRARLFDLSKLPNLSDEEVTLQMDRAAQRLAIPKMSDLQQLGMYGKKRIAIESHIESQSLSIGSVVPK